MYEEKVEILRKRKRRLPQGRGRAGTKKLKLRCKDKDCHKPCGWVSMFPHYFLEIISPS